MRALNSAGPLVEEQCTGIEGVVSQPAIASDDMIPDTNVESLEKDLRHQVLRNPGVRALIGSRFAAALGLSTLAYGAMVYLATIGAPQVAISMIGATRFFAALLFGIGGGALVEAMSKRTAMATAYALQAVACLVIPTIWGTSIPSLVVLIFIVASLGQIATPAVKASTALVSTAAQVAVVAAVISVANGIGAAIGSAFLAPILINVANLRIIIYVCGVILALVRCDRCRCRRRGKRHRCIRHAKGGLAGDGADTAPDLGMAPFQP